ncbi:hypothetical protein [Salmonella enterica]
MRKAREYAARHGTSLNRMIRRYLEQLVSDELLVRGQCDVHDNTSISHI